MHKKNPALDFGYGQEIFGIAKILTANKENYLYLRKMLPIFDRTAYLRNKEIFNKISIPI